MPDKLHVSVNGEHYELTLPPNEKFRKQNPACNKRGHFCTSINGALTCFKVELSTDANGILSIGTVIPCKHNPTGKIPIEG
jgi:hypothetical protein